MHLSIALHMHFSGSQKGIWCTKRHLTKGCVCTPAEKASTVVMTGNLNLKGPCFFFTAACLNIHENTLRVFRASRVQNRLFLAT